jgi:hypothetical protein
MSEVIGGLVICVFIFLISIFYKKKDNLECNHVTPPKEPIREPVSECRCKTKNLLRQWEQEAYDFRFK